MSTFSKITVKDRVVQYPRRYTDELGATKTFTPSEGTITEAGTSLNAAYLQRLENGIYDAHEELQTPTLSTEATETKSIFGRWADAYNGRLIAKVKGRVANNAVANGNFASTAGWTAVACSFSVSGNVATLTGDGTGAYMYIKRTLDTVYQASKKLYKLTNILAVLAGATLKVGIYDATNTTLLAEITDATYTANVYEILSAVLALTGGTAGQWVVS